ncbi:MAG: hypothetical protein ACR2P9_02315 [Gammaproteobacteria bacterium]
MSVRLLKRREGVLALTQTEIMLILATIILLLLMAKTLELARFKDDLAPPEPVEDTTGIGGDEGEEGEGEEGEGKEGEGKEGEGGEGEGLVGKIGCLPCWLRSGKRKYYFAYDITYHPDADSFSIRPNRDWERDAKIVNDALNGALSILKDFPTEQMSKDEFLNFGRRIITSKNIQHGEECRLMATINKAKVDGNVIEFVRDKVGFCPIFR